ncbi:MAG: SdrD B-like domain-containing protein [Luteolibacter sp.]
MNHHQNRFSIVRRVIFLLLAATVSESFAATTDGPLKMEVITAYNFVVDSNVESPSSFSPSAAHLGVKICNTGTSTLTNVEVNIGKLVDPLTSSGTPGTFPSRTVTVTGAKGYSGTFALQMPGGAGDAVRIIPSLAPGQCVVQYFFVTYPLKDPLGNSVAGAAPDPSDDLWLNYDIWASATDGATTRRVDKVNKVTMRNEISAMANKIWPNTTSKVPSKYLDAIEQSLGWRPDSETPQSGATAQMQGIWYDLGNVGAGFDNDGDGLPDRNAWMQPVGDPSVYSPLAMRLVKCYGIVIIKLNDGTEKLIPFEDKLYFENIPANNTGAVGLVFYEFIPLSSGNTATLSPYQEVASGHDNEKFNGDYGAASTSFTSTPPSVIFNKSGPSLVAGGGTATYSLTAQNTGTSGIGSPALSLPFVFEDAIPAGLVYVAGSATAANTIPAGNSVTVSWSTDNGATWVTTAPAASSVTRVRWTLSSALAAGTTATVGFQATVPLSYPSLSIDNTGVIRLGTSGSLTTSTVTTRLTGINSIGDLVWRDDNRDSIKDGTEPGIANVTVSLYNDVNGNGTLESTDLLYGTTVTNGSGSYGFSSLPDGKYIVVVDDADSDLPAGYTLPSSASNRSAIDLDSTRVISTAVNDLTADWPFISALTLSKTVSPTVYGAGQLINYTIDLENHAASVAAKTVPVRTAWASTVTANRSAQNPANAQGDVDLNYARLDFSQNSDALVTSGGFTYDSPTGTITKVELIFNAYLSEALVDDEVNVSVNGTVFTTLTTAQVNTLLGSASYYTVDVTSKNATWSWAQVQALTAQLKANKSGGPDPGTVWVDSIGFRVTTTTVAPPTGTYGLASIDPLPLTDTFDAARLEYVSSSLPPTSVSGGTITWANAGPLNPGGRKTITVTFRAKTTSTAVSTTNTATSTGASFVSGRPANGATSNVAVTINPRGQIGDFVFWDLNNNGAFDTGEPGIPNVLVTLDNGAQTRTDASGYYIFRNLPDGTFTVAINTASLPWTSFTQTKDPDATVNNASTVTINNSNVSTADDGYLDRDFGYRSVSNVISGYIFQDSNGNGIKDAGEIYLSGVNVALSGGPIGLVTPTDSSGYYSFGSLANGTYTVGVVQPSGTTQTLDPDATVNNATTVVASGGNLYANRNFAYRPTGSLALGDTLYYDWNGNGSQDSGENGIPDVDVFLYRDTNGDGVIDTTADPLVATAVTNASGVYGFSSLPASNYIVVVNTLDPQFPTGVIQIQDYDGTRDGKAVVNLTTSLLTVDFGYKPQGTASIGDQVFLDANGDGIKGASEAGIASVPVTLYADNNNNGVLDIGIDSVVATTTTGSTGTYLFSGLRAGNYLVNVDQNAASIPSDAFGNKFRKTTAVPHVVTLAAGQSYLAADFGFAAPAAIGDTVFYDSNGNATQDASESGIPNVTVQLFLDANQDGQPDSPTPIATTVTATGSGSNPAGFYQFTNLAAGTYFVKVLTSTLPQSGGLPIPLTADPDRDGVPVNDNTYPSLPAGDDGDSLVIVSLGGNYTGADFGYQPPGAIGDFIWLDLDKDGVQDSGEPGIANVTVQISNGTTTYTTTTDFDGGWSYANIPDGAWTVSIPSSNFSSGAPLENRINTFDADGGSNSSTAIVLTNGVVNLAAGNLGLDFGYGLNGAYALSGTVITHDTRVLGTADDVDDFYDDGIDQDAGPDDEIELSGVEVYLYTTGGIFLGSTVTDSAGNYTFNGLPSGDYRVIIGTTSDALQNSTLTTTVANNTAVSSVNAASGTSVIQTLTVGSSDVTDVDFAFISNSNYDYGDLPLGYAATTLSQDGARHIIPGSGSTLYLGTAPDADTNGIPNALAEGDDSIGSDDEDGVSTVDPVLWMDGTAMSGNGGQIQVNVTGSGWLVGWIDWNHDGDFLDSGEMIVSQAVNSGSLGIAFDIPAGTIGATSESWLSRFRLFTAKPPYPLFSYAGVTTDGEVEDHLLEKPVGGSIGDLVWNDTNGNGIRNTGETGIGGLTVELRDNGGTLIATQATGDGTTDVDGDGVIDPAGYYRFRGLNAGTYSVTVSTPPVGFSPSYDENGIGTPHVTSVTLGSGIQYLSADFGYVPAVANISGQVRYDADSDGDLNDTDNGAMVVKIQLWTDPNGDGDPSDGVQVGETYTDANGNYLFASVPTGKYVVVEINPPGTTSTADFDGGNFDRIAVSLTGSNVTGLDFLDTEPPLFAVSGTVYDDNDTTNDNVIGVDDTPLAAVTVKLYLDRDKNGLVSAGDTLLESTTTNGTGGYAFTGLPAGSYVVEETDPTGATSEWDAQGLLTDNQIGVTVTNANITQRNFLDDGYLGSISGSVLVGNSPLEDVTLTLVDSAGNPVDGDPDTAGVQEITTTTAANGSYSFANLPPGTYGVKETQPVGYMSVSDKDGGDLDEIRPIAVSAGTPNTGNDFIEALGDCPSNWAEWKVQNPGEGAAGNPDGDAYDNLTEFAFAMGVNSGAGDAYHIQPSTITADTIDAVFTRPDDAVSNVVYTLQYAATVGNPTVWTSIPITPAVYDVVDNGDCTETITIKDLETLTGLTGGKGVVRIKVELDEAPPSGIDHTSYTEVEGWKETAFGMCCQTYGFPYLRDTEFTGTVDAGGVSGYDVSFSASAGSTNLSTLLDPGSSYYMEVTSGIHEGQRFDIASASGSTVTLAADSDLHSKLPPFSTIIGAIPTDLAESRVVIRRHWKLSEVFPPSGFGSSTDQALADQLQIFSGGTWTILHLFDDAGTPRWVDNFNTQVDQGDLILQPGQGLFLNNRNSPRTLLSYGEVRTNDFIRPLATGSNLVSGGYPLSQSANLTGSRAMSVASGFFGSKDFKTADSFFIWKGDTTEGLSTYDTYYLLNGAPQSPTLLRWVKVGDAALTSRDAEVLLLENRAAFTRSAPGMPNYGYPSPWTP